MRYLGMWCWLQAQLLAVLRQYAPTWLTQLPALWDMADGAGAPALQSGTTPARMLRELAEALDVLTATRPLVLVLEDLHWSDHATLDLLSWLARRREAARLLVIGTYRPIEVIVQGHPLQAVQQELVRHQQCVEVRLAGLSTTEVAAYLAARLPGGLQLAGLAAVLAERTAGQPLFIVQVVDAWLRDGQVVDVAGQWEVPGGLAALATDVPASVRQLIEQQLEGCRPAEQRVLAAASVVGETFAAAAVAAGLDVTVKEVEAQCEALVQRGQFLQGGGVEVWPDGTVAGRYGFRHGVHQQVVYDRLPVGWRIQLHRRVGERKEAGYGVQVQEVAAELAVHFAEGRDAWRAVHYRQQAAQNALRRYAYQEVIGHLGQGLEWLAMLPETPARVEQELAMQISLGPVLVATRGYAAPEVEQAYARARVLCQQAEETPQLFPTLRGLCRFYLGRGALPTARQLGEQLERLARRTADPMHRLEAHDALGTTLFFLGEYPAARTYLEEGGVCTDPAVQRDLVRRHVEPPGPRCLATLANTLWCLGYPAQAMQRGQEALAQAQDLAHAYTLATARHWVAQLHYRRREVAAVQAQADALLTLATAQGFPLLVGFGTFWRGWALAMQGEGEAGLAQIRQGMAAAVATGHGLSRPLCLVLLAEAAGHVGQVAEGLHLLNEALTAFEASGRGELLPEVYRLQGELLLQQEGTSHRGNSAEEATACFQRALAVARQQQARALELRAACSMATLWQQQGQPQAARTLLEPIYGWFTEGFDTADLQAARALLQALGGASVRPAVDGDSCPACS